MNVARELSRRLRMPAATRATASRRGTQRTHKGAA